MSLKILLTDDHPDSLDMLRELLSVYTADIRTARSGGEAIKVALAWEPDVLITDIEMPDMDGRHVARRLKISLPNLVAIAVSGTALTTDFASDDDLVFDHYFVKPIHLPRLHAVLSEYAATTKE